MLGALKLVYDLPRDGRFVWLRCLTIGVAHTAFWAAFSPLLPY
jgi:hypothetical protein